ncbi:glycoside hydrolase family 25 protein [Archangium sp.]|uniref:glycoside hydrolase family 25 protein n=1 Tax=Archangium sp. TaxID=1872627 RepID=UPI002D4EC0B5|nr:GH25 family lysozyme [Archangium sp.]HYO52276.1 GH25 family lysozyme [Archangium sp.]
MKKTWSLLLVGGALTLAGCGGVEMEQDQVTDPAPQDREMGAVMGDGFRELGMMPISEGPSEMATVCAGSTVVRGIDVSYYQGTINWNSVKSAGKSFAIIRVSDGTGFQDPNFNTYWANAKAAGMTVGAYQFFRPTQDPIAQADLMVNKLNSAGFAATDIPPVIDVEVTGGLAASTVISRVNTWLQRVQSRTGRLPMLYTSPGFWSGLGNPTPSPLPYLWVAHWGATCPTLPPAWGRLRVWQYSATGAVSGISGDVDLDLYNGPLSELRSL